jgi:hypothetical protein
MEPAWPSVMKKPSQNAIQTRDVAMANAAKIHAPDDNAPPEKIASKEPVCPIIVPMPMSVNTVEFAIKI